MSGAGWTIREKKIEKKMEIKMIMCLEWRFFLHLIRISSAMVSTIQYTFQVCQFDNMFNFIERLIVYYITIVMCLQKGFCELWNIQQIHCDYRRIATHQKSFLFFRSNKTKSTWAWYRSTSNLISTGKSLECSLVFFLSSHTFPQNT